MIQLQCNVLSCVKRHGSRNRRDVRRSTPNGHTQRNKTRPGHEHARARRKAQARRLRRKRAKRKRATACNAQARGVRPARPRNHASVLCTRTRKQNTATPPASERASQRPACREQEFREILFEIWAASREGENFEKFLDRTFLSISRNKWLSFYSGNYFHSTPV